MLNRLRNANSTAERAVEAVAAILVLLALATSVYALYKGNAVTAGFYLLFVAVLTTNGSWASFAMSGVYFATATATAVQGMWAWTAVCAIVGWVWLVSWKRKTSVR